MLSKKYRLISNLDDQWAQGVLRLYRQAWWANQRNLVSTVSVLRGSSFTCGILNDRDQLVAFGRVVSDGIEKATIYDIIVQEDQRGLGLGQMIIDAILNSEEVKSVMHIELYCKEEMIPFYEKAGFKDISVDVKLLRLVKPL